jgi:hypothetical protein
MRKGNIDKIIFALVAVSAVKENLLDLVES